MHIPKILKVILHDLVTADYKRVILHRYFIAVYIYFFDLCFLKQGLSWLVRDVNKLIWLLIIDPNSRMHIL